MKKLFLLALLAIASLTEAFAQARAGGELSSKDYTGGGVTSSRNTGFGIKGGYNYANLYGDGADGLNLQASKTFHAGAYGQFGFNNFASVQVEILYSRKGAKSDGAGAEDLRLDYLQVPVLFVGNITETLSFHVGPQVSLLTKVKQGSEDVAIDAAGFNSLDYGAVGGVEARLGPARLGARYDLGLANIIEDKSISSDKVRTGTFQVYLGIGFTQ